ncbi:hypothetical protein Naga_103583g1 [Nannochloropsis gaditana]|uniref:Uncharacterized protein n=1 Tax=Nannochloropsis gaditana TaxID=72520 RepID=W7U394_9STRA|nr:hypothetical protein Naga_103583g1 [Nannochloropsis gaditana]
MMPIPSSSLPAAEEISRSTTRRPFSLSGYPRPPPPPPPLSPPASSIFSSSASSASGFPILPNASPPSPSSLTPSSSPWRAGERKR